MSNKKIFNTYEEHEESCNNCPEEFNFEDGNCFKCIWEAACNSKQALISKNLQELQKIHYDSTTPMDDYHTGMYNGIEVCIRIISGNTGNELKSVERLKDEKMQKENEALRSKLEIAKNVIKNFDLEYSTDIQNRDEYLRQVGEYN